MTTGEELVANLAAVRQRIAAACARAGRDPAEVTLVAVTKAHPEEAVRRLAALGVRDVAENRDQEGAAKAAACADLPLVWHFVGRLQTNKARSVASYADVVHSVDRLELVEALSKGALRAGREIDCLVQVSLDEHPGSAGQRGVTGRGGAAPDAVAGLADAVSHAPGLRLRGVMAIAPLGRPPGPAFELLEQVAQQLREQHPEARWISAGMTGDLEAAIAFGATHVRVGTALLGPRTNVG